MENTNNEYQNLPNWINILRVSVRPITTYILTFLFVYGFLHPDKYNTNDMGILSTLLIIVYTFWFGERMIKNTGIVKVLKEVISKKKDEIKEPEKDK